MPSTVNDIKRGLNHLEVMVRSIDCNRIELKNKPKVCAVTYFFEIANIAGNVPVDRALQNNRDYNSSEGDNFRPFRIDTVDEGVQLCRDLCLDLNIPFTKQDEDILRKDKRNTDWMYLFIRERPTFII